MPLVPALCTQCGSRLEIDTSQQVDVCPYCHTPFITEKAINNYNTTNVNNIGNLHAEVVNVYDDISIDNRVKSGETFIRQNDYISAERVFEPLTKEYPYEYRGWYGLIKVYSKNFSDKTISRGELFKIENLFNNACTVATQEEINDMNKKYRAYYNCVKSNLDTEMNSLNQEMAQLYAELKAKKARLQRSVNNAE